MGTAGVEDLSYHPAALHTSVPSLVLEEPPPIAVIYAPSY